MKYQRVITEIKNYCEACQCDGEKLLDIDILGILLKHDFPASKLIEIAGNLSSDLELYDPENPNVKDLETWHKEHYPNFRHPAPTENLAEINIDKEPFK